MAPGWLIKLQPVDISRANLEKLAFQSGRQQPAKPEIGRSL